MILRQSIAPVYHRVKFLNDQLVLLCFSVAARAFEFRGASPRRLPCVLPWPISGVPWFNLSSLHRHFTNSVAAPPVNMAYYSRSAELKLHV